MARGNVRARSARTAAEVFLISGSLVISVLSPGCDRRSRSEEGAPPAVQAADDQTSVDRTGKAGGKAVAKAGDRGGKSQPGAAAAGKAEASGAKSGRAPDGSEKAKTAPEKSKSARAGTSKRDKKGSPSPPPPVVPDVPVSSLSDEELAAQVEALRQENARLGSEVAALEPQEPYILINTTLNRLSMKKGDAYIVRDAVVSTGSNTELVDAKGQRRWFFSTPKGVHTVKKKMIAPIWVKPDWAFVEEGEPIPGAQAEARFEEGTLGKYGLYFGNGYIVHGTLFQRFLGQSVTHGCVRVGDADLELVYANASVGTRIYIY